ncbi:MAG TPA: hypothetical protein VEA60_07155 [Allosphingosinicella sp.]|nr:hypothetical protein [Allosphingosinicella sp.]
MNRPALTPALAAALVLAGCSSTLQVKEIGNGVAPGTAVDGIPFRMPKRYTLKLYERTPSGYQEVHQQPVTLADPDRLFLLGFESMPLANSTVDFKMNPDNTLQQVGLKSESKGAGALTEVGAQAAAFGKALETEETARATEATTTSTRAIAADKAWQAAEEAQLALDNLLKDASASNDAVLKARNKARSAKLDANEAARLAGRAPYYPDVVP